jgi:hypothetical protein
MPLGDCVLHNGKTMTKLLIPFLQQWKRWKV